MSVQFFNSFFPNVPIWFNLNTSENVCFPDVFGRIKENVEKEWIR